MLEGFLLGKISFIISFLQLVFKPIFLLKNFCVKKTVFSRNLEMVFSDSLLFLFSLTISSLASLRALADLSFSEEVWALLFIWSLASAYLVLRLFVDQLFGDSEWVAELLIIDHFSLKISF